MDNTLPPTCQKTYQTTKTETCSSLAAATGQSIYAILKINPQIVCTNIPANQILCIQRSDAYVSYTNPCPNSRYTVKPNETCQNICDATGIPLNVFTTTLNVGIDCTKALPTGLEVCLGYY